MNSKNKDNKTSTPSHEKDMMQIDVFLNHLSSAKLPEGRGKNNVWESISKEITIPKTKTKRITIPIPYWKPLAIAASVAIIFVLFVPMFKTKMQKIQYSTRMGEFKAITLPDESIVTLNAESSISYKKPWDRKIHLSGEAFFQVSERGKFVVNSDIGMVQVLGTSFNVKVRESDFAVACKTGKVNVIIVDKNYNNVLTSGKYISLKDNTIIERDIQLTLIDGWIAGEFYFENQPVGDVLLELQRQFKTEINIEQIDTSRLFSGYFTNDNVEEALKTVCFPMNLIYKKNDNEYVLENKK